MSNYDLSEVPTNELWTLFQENSGSFRLEVACEIARRLHQDKNWIELIAICETALDDTDAPTDFFPRGYLCFQIGYANYSLGRFNESVTAYLQAVPLYREAGDYPSVANSLRNATDGLMELEDYDEVVRIANQGLEVCELENVRFIAGDLHIRKARVFSYTDDPENALEEFTTARKMFRSDNMTSGMIRVDHERVSLLLQLDRPSEAVEVASGLLVMAQNNDNPADEISAAIKLADALNQDGQSDKALVLCQELNPLFINNATASQKAELKIEWGIALAASKDPQAAARMFRESRTLAEYGNTVWLQATALEQAYINSIGYDSSEMRWSLREMINLAAEHEIAFRYFLARCRLLELELDEGDLDAAAIQVKLISEFDPTGLSHHVQNTAERLKALYYYRIGELALAQAAAEKGLAFFEHHSDEMLKAETYGIWALVQLEMGLVGPGDALISHAIAFALTESVYDLAEALAAKIASKVPFPTYLPLQYGLAE